MVRKDRRKNEYHPILDLKIRSQMLKDGTLARSNFQLESRISFLENTVVLMIDALERRKRKKKS